MKKLFIQIPCLNEAETIDQVIKDIPKKELEDLNLDTKILVIDDGSFDETAKIAKKAGADFILRHKKTLGLAKTFADGVNFCLQQQADIIVNTDGDNQYDQKEILKIVKPILEERADMAIGNRLITKLKFMPQTKKLGNQIGSWMIRLLTGLKIRDGSSGFRAFSRNLALKFNLQSSHTYTHETIIQAANFGAIIVDVPITFRKRISGESRLISGIFDHIKRSSATIIRVVLTYKAFKYLLTIGSLIMFLGVLGVGRFLYFYLSGNGGGHVQSLVIASVLINLGFIIIVLGIIADLIAVNRKMLEEINLKLKSSK